MEDEVLNIEHHVKRLVVKSLTVFQFKSDAAAALGVSVKTLNGFIKRWQLPGNGVDQLRD